MIQMTETDELGAAIPKEWRAVRCVRTFPDGMQVEATGFGDRLEVAIERAIRAAYYRYGLRLRQANSLYRGPVR